MAAGARTRMRCSVSRASTSIRSPQQEPDCFCGSRPVKRSAAALTAGLSRWAMDGARSGSMTFPVSAGRCGCGGPSVSAAARTRAARGRHSPRSTRWPGPGRNSRPGPLGGRPTRCSALTPRSPPWPTSSVSHGTRPGTPSRQRPSGASVSQTGWPGRMHSASMSISGPISARPALAWSPGSWTTPAT